jgi:hypothetical protein
MGFLKYANAKVITPDINFSGWEDLSHSAGLPQKTATKQIIQEYSPKDVMLTHCTIIASVDTEASGQPLGKHKIDGFEVNREFSDWLITPETSKYVNNNHDAWSRPLLLSAFRTFIGGENYLEHIQIPELSKGKILDAVARDVGDSIYVDILVATERKHKELIAAITKNQLTTLSMGCSVVFTVCSRCGNVAPDEISLCPHIKYFKGNEWFDELGKKRIVAELCGHVTREPNSVKFIEASWVANPAFRGAVMRSILSFDGVSLVESSAVGKNLFSMRTPARTRDPGLIAKAAGQQEDFLTNPTPEENPAEDPMDSAVTELTDELQERAVKKLRQRINKDDVPNQPVDKNDTLVKTALKSQEWRGIARMLLGHTRNVKRAKRLFVGLLLLKQGGVKKLASEKYLTAKELLVLSRFLDRYKKKSFAGEQKLYRAVVEVGGIKKHASKSAYLDACRRQLGRTLTADEEKILVEKGILYSCGV